MNPPEEGIPLKKLLFTLLLLWLTLMCAGALAVTATVKYTPVECGKPTTFTFELDTQPDTENGGYVKYSLTTVWLWYDNTRDMIFSPVSTLSEFYGYRTDNTFQFTFYASGTYRMDFRVLYRQDGNSTVQNPSVPIDVVVKDPDYPCVEDIADGLVAQAKQASDTDYGRALWLHDWIIDHTAYDSKLMYCSVEGALARGLSICNSYQAAYAMLLDRLGIPNKQVKAVVSGGGHTWNLVRLDGQWCHIDPTWDDDKTERHLYFGVTDELISLSQGHQPFTADASAPAVSLSNHYYIRSGEASKWGKLYTAAIQEKLDQDLTGFTIPRGKLQDNTYNDDIRAAIAAFWLSQQEWTASYGKAALAVSYNAADAAFVCKVAAVGPEQLLSLPASLTAVGTDALSGTGASCIRVPASLTDSAALAALPADLLWLCEGDTAATYAREHNIPFICTTKDAE